MLLKVVFSKANPGFGLQDHIRIDLGVMTLMSWKRSEEVASTNPKRVTAWENRKLPGLLQPRKMNSTEDARLELEGGCLRLRSARYSGPARENKPRPRSSLTRYRE